jgi:hypothetical protein
MRIAVFCGSRTGTGDAYRAAAAALGRSIASRGLGLVYGGGSVGLMGVLADAALGAGGEVIGVIPDILASAELAHAGITRMHVVPSMHARKALMADLADAFAVLPGGYGTLDELFEVVTWAQLGIHTKPIGLANIGGYFDPLVGFLDHAVAEGFVTAKNRGLFVVRLDPDALLDALLERFR